MTDLSWDDIKKRREPARESVPVCLSQSIVDELARLNDELSFARMEDRRHEGELDYAPKAKAIADRIIEVESSASDSEVQFVFQEIPRAKWNALLRAHPPTEKQRKEGIRDFNPETFPTVAIEAGLVSPKMTSAEVHEMCEDEEDGFPEGEIRKMFNVVMGLSMGSRELPKGSGLASEVIREFGAGSEPLSDSESPPPSSTVE